MELELGAPGVFGLSGPEPDEARAELQDSIAAARRLGVRILRTGYGRLTVETSRFNKQMTVSEHLEKLAANLRLAAPLIEEAGLLLAIENHCDFTGREMAALFDRVSSPVVGCALDTANGFTVFCDPNEDVQVLAPYAFTTHMKDMVAFDYKVPRQLPILFTGCALGQGHVDIPLAVRTLAEKSPYANGLHLIVELWPVPAPEGRDPLEVKHAAFVDSVAFLQQLIREPAAS
jgi:3-oxoisoapionate decarboxylase